ncbi:RNA polymerase subunit sigma [uncultured Chryseobacterium sp.]|uniref:RNA polymerase subunit sigma n=1 Tax=uncultured Chryseobacterium sp. TaxID=259322 RepID=UPI00374A4830
MKVEQKNTSEIIFEALSGDDLIDYISFKNEYPHEATLAFTEFCNRYERDILKKAEIYCNKYNYSEVVALEVATCAFVRVWKYHSFNKNKAKYPEDMDRSILLWLYPIVYNEMIKYGERNTCTEPSEDDLSVVENIDELITLTVGEDVERKRDLRVALEVLEKAMQGLSEKHKIVYLTYKAYENTGKKNLPRTVGKKLRNRLNLVQSSIQVYKKEATDHINKYLEYLNGSR